MGWLSKIFKPAAKPVQAAPATPPPKNPDVMWERPTMINWLDPKAKISKYFTVHEALYLPTWKTYHVPSEEEKINILKTAVAMDAVREFLGTPISVHVWIRPTKANCPSSPHHGQDYNAVVKGAKSSPHIKGLAVDWHSTGTCDEVRTKLKPELERLNICVEDLPKSVWVHMDIMPPRGGTRRFFLP